MVSSLSVGRRRARPIRPRPHGGHRRHSRPVCRPARTARNGRCGVGSQGAAPRKLPRPAENRANSARGPRIACGTGASGASHAGPAWLGRAAGDSEAHLCCHAIRGRPSPRNKRRSSTRRSNRAARCALSCPMPVDEAMIREILEVAARAPSGTNMQPWRVYVTTGEVKQRITDAILNSGIRAEKAKWDEYKYYPEQFFEPYLHAAAARSASRFTASSASAGATSTRCAPSTTATSSSSTRRSA